MDITPKLINYKAAADFLIHRLKHTTYSNKMSAITKAFRIEYYNLSKLILKNRRQVIPCYSGVNSVQISPDGDVWTCCTKAKPLGNLKESSYNLRKIWRGALIRAERQSIRNKECFCPLANAAYTNMIMDIKTVRRVMSKSSVRELSL